MTDLSKTIEHIKKIESFGGPKWYDWCDISAWKSPLITGAGWAPNEGGECCEVDDADVVCMPAVHAAIIAWCGEVRAWNAQDEVFAIELGNAQLGWVWSVLDYAENVVEQGYEPSQLAACVKIIEAVADNLGETK